MKRVIGIYEGEQLPTNAKYLSSGIVQLEQQALNIFFYEMPEKEWAELRERRSVELRKQALAKGVKPGIVTIP